jgi:hypothetical protein
MMVQPHNTSVKEKDEAICIAMGKSLGYIFGQKEQVVNQ